MANVNFDHFRNKLLEEKQQILEQISKGNEPPPHMNPDRDDLAQDFITLEKDVAIKALEREQLELIDNALKRIDRGQYGICANCKKPIPVERLEILPYAELCVDCQSTQERRW